MSFGIGQYNNNVRDLFIRVKPIIDHQMRALCAKPYPGHTKGCPKLYKGCPTCPPQVPVFEKVFDVAQPILAVITTWDMARQVEKMRANNPDWGDRQLRNLLYWQASARTQLEEKVAAVLAHPDFSHMIYTMCPEGMGVNVTETLRLRGVHLQWPPVTIAHQVALLGMPKEIAHVP